MTDLSLASVSPAIVSADGGARITLTGSFALGTAYTVQIAGAACYGGVPSQGYTAYCINGVTLTCFSPVLTIGPPLDVTVSGGGASVTLTAALTVLAPFYDSEVFSLRTILPVDYVTGPRSVADLPSVP